MHTVKCFQHSKWLNRSIWNIAGTLTGTTLTQRGQSGLGSIVNERVLPISQNSSRALPLDTCWEGGLTPQQRCSQCMLQSKLTGLKNRKKTNILNIILNWFIWPLDETLTDFTTLSQSEPGNNGNKGLTCHSSKTEA